MTPLVTIKSTSWGYLTLEFARRGGFLECVWASCSYCLFLFPVKWLNFSPHCAFPCVFWLFARNPSMKERKAVAMANFLIKSITTRKANTTLSTITKLSSEGKRNPSTSWLLRNPRKGLGKFNWPLFALIVEMQFCFEGKLEAYPSYGFSVHKDPLWMQCFSYIMLLCSCQYSKCHFLCVKVKIMKTTVWLCEGISRRRRLLSVWIARGKYSNWIYFSRLEYLMLKKKPQTEKFAFTLLANVFRY